MVIGFIIFDNFTTLDFVGVYDPLIRLKSMGFMPDLEWYLCAQSDSVTDDRGLVFTPDEVNTELEGYDVLIVPGGKGTRELRNDDEFISWLQTSEDTPIIASVCTGSLLLASAGLLAGHRATSHLNALELLAEYGVDTSTERVVDSGAVVTARGVTSSIDLGLHLVERLAGFEVRRRISKQMDYEQS